MLEQLAGHDRVEGSVGEGKRLLDVRLDRLDPERLGLRERGAVDVESDDLVPLEEVARQRSGAAAEVEHALAAADGLPEERDPLRNEDEVALVPPLPVMLLVPTPEVLGHSPTTSVTRRRRPRGPARRSSS